MCYIDDILTASPTLNEGIDGLDEAFDSMKRAYLKSKPSKCVILKDPMRYLERMIDKQRMRPKTDAVEAVLT